MRGRRRLKIGRFGGTSYAGQPLIKEKGQKKKKKMLLERWIKGLHMFKVYFLLLRHTETSFTTVFGHSFPLLKPIFCVF